MEAHPPHHDPFTQGLDLATHESVADAWEEFFRLVTQYATAIRARRAAQTPPVQDTSQPDETAAETAGTTPQSGW